jgi:DNA-directed RNA polymerase subunit RPC12/RpoP
MVRDNQMLTLQDLIWAKIGVECDFCGKVIDELTEDSDRYDDTVTWSIQAALLAEKKGWTAVNNEIACPECSQTRRG